MKPTAWTTLRACAVLLWPLTGMAASLGDTSPRAEGALKKDRVLCPLPALGRGYCPLPASTLKSEEKMLRTTQEKGVKPMLKPVKVARCCGSQTCDKFDKKDKDQEKCDQVAYLSTASGVSYESAPIVFELTPSYGLV